MRSAHTVDEVRRAEGELLAALPEGALMQRAAAGLAYAVLDLLGEGYGRRVLLLVGSGDNGGDALYAGAMLARRGAAVEAILLSPDKAHPKGLAALREAGGRVVADAQAAHTPEVVLDGVVGIGGKGPLREDAAKVVEQLRGVPFVAVDVPSGVDVDTGEVEGPHVEAAVTVTFGTHKIAHLVDPAALACGAVHLVDIGLDLPETALTSLQAEDVARMLPVPEPSGHKYSRGLVGVRAGSEQFPGAGVLCVAGASSGFAGMVRYDGGAADLVRQAHPEVVVGPGQVQAWVVGSGGGHDAGEALRSCLEDDVPVVVDADGLAHVSGPLGVPALLTPHAGELSRMLGVEREEVEAQQLRFAREAASHFGAVVLLKGRHTLVA
ncbi:MAG TPA: NAD(P)H-hydrate epimerase, partial [Pedococcus sp.]|nr:NAD(P)H-hydrate epimerase [Pedococcus sp.]